jgi:hypothetical protein
MLIAYTRDTQPGYGLDGRGSIPYWGKNLFLFRSNQTRFWVRPASSPMGTGGSFSGGKPSEA